MAFYRPKMAGNRTSAVSGGLFRPRTVRAARPAPKTLYASRTNTAKVSIMAVKIPREVALSICEKIREENRSRPLAAQARQCRSCEACCGGAALKSPAGDRACCLVRQRCARLVATAA